jgi:tryptophanyl-tRNA synthetase
MSKSYGNTIPLFAEDAEIDRLVMSIVTDSAGAGEAKDPEKDTVFALHRLFSADALADLAARYREGSIGYRESKEMLAANLKAFVRPLREKRRVVGEDRAAPLDALARGAERARERAAAKLAEVRARVGVALDG